MARSKDQLRDQVPASQIEAELATDQSAGANTVAIEVPYDSANSYSPPVSPGYETTWVNAAHALGLHVWVRSHWNSWEGDYGFPKETPTTTPGLQLGTAAAVLDGQDTTSYLALTYYWILDHPTYFQNGDIFTPAAEPENAGILPNYCGTPPCMFSSDAGFNQWLQDSMTVDRGAFAQLHVNVQVGYWGTSGWLTANGYLTNATVNDMGILDVDDYLQSPAALVANLAQIEATYNVPLVVGEWGDIWDSGNQELMGPEINSIMSAVSQLSYVTGFNYFRDITPPAYYGQEGIVDATTLQLNPAGLEVAYWFQMTGAATGGGLPQASSSPVVSAISPSPGPVAGSTTVTITGTGFAGATAVDFGTTRATSYTVTSATSVTATSPAESAGTVNVTVTTPSGTSATSSANQFTYTTTGNAYTPLAPTRLLDTRTNGGTLGPNGSLNLTVTGGSVPSDATAVALNVTVTNTTAASYLSVYPTGGAQPHVSNLNWTMGETVPNSVIVPVGTGGSVTFYNYTGNTDVVVDLEGYFASEPSGTTAGSYVPLTPSRITDTRAGSGEPNAGQTLGPGSTLNVQVTGAGGVPASGVTAALLNVTVTDTTSASYLTVYPQGETQPLASNLNWGAGETVANRVVVPVSSTGMITLYNYTGRTDVVVDVSGYLTNGSSTPTNASLYYPITPVRVLDTRQTGATLSGGAALAVPMAGVDGIASDATSVVTNITATDTTAASFFTGYPGGTSRPTVSDVNWMTGQTVPNLTVATPSSTGSISIYDQAGSADVIVDAFGYFSLG